MNSSSIKYLIIPFALLLFSLLTLRGQSMEDISNSYELYNQISASNASKQDKNNALIFCCDVLRSALENSRQGSDAYLKALQIVPKIVPSLLNAAAYYDSNSNQAEAARFAEAYIGIAQIPSVGSQYVASDNYPQMAYYAARFRYISKEYDKAIADFKAYLKSYDNKYRKDVYEFMSQACAMIEDYETGLQSYDEAVSRYGSDYALLSRAINYCINCGDVDHLEKYLQYALRLKPDDQTLKLIQGKLYEDKHNYSDAFKVFFDIHKNNPNDANVVKHLAINTYNLGVLNNNSAAFCQNNAEVSKFKRISNDYFNLSVCYLSKYLEFDPTSVRLLEALAVAYSCTGNTSKMEAANTKLASLGRRRISSDIIPQFIESEESDNKIIRKKTGSNGIRPDAPLFSIFAKEYVEKELSVWQKKDQFETPNEYIFRVSDVNRKKKIEELINKAESEYIRKFSRVLSISDFRLNPYDAENETFLIDALNGQKLVLPIPRQNDEAQIFSTSWKQLRLDSPCYCISDDKLAIASINFLTPYGKLYTYNNLEKSTYVDFQIDAQFDKVDDSMLSSSSLSSNHSINQSKISVGKSDVDLDVPESAISRPRTYAVIIANEDYLNVASVPHANNDGSMFKKYCEKTLGIPSGNIIYVSNASYGIMLRALWRLNQIASTYAAGEMNVIFYYAGHGIPDESTKQSYILPIDGDGYSTEGCYSTGKLYSELAKTKAGQILVFLDACFSGAQRGDGMINSARSVVLNSKASAPSGNMIVFSAATANETALPYTEKGHGLFTYFLLKKLNESKGQISLGALSDYLYENVTRLSVREFSKLQTPTTSATDVFSDAWRNMHIQ